MDNYVHLIPGGDLYSLFGSLAASKAYVPVTMFAAFVHWLPGLGISVTSMKPERLLAMGKDPYTTERLYSHSDHPRASLKKILHVLWIPSSFDMDSAVGTSYEANHFVLLRGDTEAPTQQEVLHKWSGNPPNGRKPVYSTEDILAAAHPESKKQYLVSENK